MKHFLRIAALLALFAFPSFVYAASCFWVPLVVTNAIAGTGGLCRLTVNSTTGLTAGATVIVSGILGSTACDGTTTVTTVVSSTLVEVNLTFNILYTSGGTVAGGLFSTTNTGNWASSTGGTVGTCAATGGVPKQSADTATFDGASGGGTIIVDSTINGVTLSTLSAGAFTGALDFSVNNPSITFTTLNLSGSGTRTINLGSGTFTFTNSNSTVIDVSVGTGLTPIFSNATFVFNASGAGNQSANLGNGLSGGWGTINIGAHTGGSGINFSNSNTVTIGTLIVATPADITFTGSTTTITNAFNLAGSSSQPLVLRAGGASNIIHASAVSTISWTYLRGLTFNTSAVTATNSFDGGGNSGVTITPPSSGGGRIIGG